MKKKFYIPKYVLIYPVVSMLLYLGIGIMTPVQAIFFRSEGLSLFHIGVMATVLEGSILLFEIPTGYIADRWGRNISVACTFICFVVSGWIFLKFRSFYGFGVSVFIQGIGYTCMSGAFEAWGVDSLNSRKDGEYLQNLIVSATQSRRIGFLAGSLLGGFLGIKMIDELLMICMVINIICFVLVMIFMKEKYRTKKKEAVECGEKERAVEKFFNIKSSIIVKFIVIISAIGMLQEFAMSPIEEYWTIFFAEDLKMRVSYIGIIVVVINVSVILLIKPMTKIISEKYGNLKALKILTGLLGVSLGYMIFSKHWAVAVGMYIFFKVVMGIYEPIHKAYLNTIVRGEYRATVLSTYSMVGAGGEIISGVLVGVVAEVMGIKYAFGISLIGFIVIVLLFGMAERVINKENVEYAEIE